MVVKAHLTRPVNREFAALRRAFHLAARASKVAAIPHFSVTREDTARKGFFEPGQFQAVLDELPDYLKAPIQVHTSPAGAAHRRFSPASGTHLDQDAGWLRLDLARPKTARAECFH